MAAQLANSSRMHKLKSPLAPSSGQTLAHLPRHPFPNDADWDSWRLRYLAQISQSLHSNSLNAIKLNKTTIDFICVIKRGEHYTICSNSPISNFKFIINNLCTWENQIYSLDRERRNYSYVKTISTFSSWLAWKRPSCLSRPRLSSGNARWRELERRWSDDR